MITRPRYPVSVFADPAEASELVRNWDFQRGWGVWLQTAFAWDDFATLTFSNPTPAPVASKRFDGWVRRLEQRAQQRVDAFHAVERGAGGLIHVHGLLRGTASLEPEDLTRAWKWGRAVCRRYEATGGAAQYITKSVGLEGVEYDLRVRADPNRLPGG